MAPRKYILLAALLSFCWNSYAQQEPEKSNSNDGILASDGKENDTTKKVSPWKAQVMFSTNLAGVLVYNWVGTEPNQTFNSSMNLKVTYAKKKNIFHSETWFTAGFNRPGDSVWKKNLDLLYIRNTYLHQIYKRWHFAAVMDFSTQLFNGYLEKDVNGKNYKYKISSFLSPTFINYGVGGAYIEKHFYAGVAPLAFSHYFIVDKSISPALYGIEPDGNDYDYGALFRAGYTNSFFKDKVFVNSQASLFDFYSSKYVYFSMNNSLRLRIWKWLLLNTDVTFIYNNQSNTLSLETNNSTGIPTGVNMGSPKLQTFITYGIGISLMLPAP